MDALSPREADVELLNITVPIGIEVDNLQRAVAEDPQLQKQF